MNPELQEIKDIVIGDSKEKTLSEIMEMILAYIDRETAKKISEKSDKTEHFKTATLLLIEAYIEKARAYPESHQILYILGQLKRELETNILS